MDEVLRQRMRKAAIAELAKRKATRAMSGSDAKRAEREAKDTERLGHRPRVTFELVPCVWLRVRGETDLSRDKPGINAMPKLPADRGVVGAILDAELMGLVPSGRVLRAGGGALSELFEPEVEELLRTYLLSLDCIEEYTDAV